MPNPPNPGRVQRTIEDFRRKVLAGEDAQMVVMARRWLQVERGLEAESELLAREAAELRAQGNPVTASRLYQMERYRTLLAHARAETMRYEKWAADEISDRQEELARLGVQYAQETIRNSYLDAGKSVARFNLLPIEAVEAMIGYASSGTPLNDLLMRDYADSIERLTQTLVRSTAQGINPRKTAAQMAEAMSGNLQRALVIARTEQLRAYRQAATQQMKASGVVEGWIWRCALQVRTCLACLAMDGQQFSLEDELDDHPCGRCFKQPVIAGLEPIAAESGAEWFARQSDETQQAMMGQARWDAWKEGKFDFEALARVNNSEEWGSSVRVAGIDELAKEKNQSEITNSIVDEFEINSNTFMINGIRITQERQSHWRNRHPEVNSEIEEMILLAAIERPEYEVSSKSDPQAMIKYTKDQNGKWWAVVVAMGQDQQPFVLTIRRAHGPGK